MPDLLLIPGDLAELTARFEFVSGSPDPLREFVQFDRTNTAFHDLNRLARLFLSDTTGFEHHYVAMRRDLPILFAMNSLFEEFIGQSTETRQDSLQRRLVHLQHSKHCRCEKCGR